jgi:uncharacterized membrane protein YfcA
MHHPILLLAAAGLLAGAMNAIAGGGSFVTFPAMVFAGLPPVIANASSTVALFPGSLASTWAYRRELTGTVDIRLRWMLPASLAGGLCGALLLLFTPEHLFDVVIPWLLLLATLTFAFGARAGAALRRVVRIGPATLLVVQFVISLYGGYFGGAVGLMMLAAWGLLTASVNVKAMGPARTLLVSAANGAAVLLFICSGVVQWPETLALLVGAVAGGYGGARVARRLPPVLVRAIVLLLTATITAVFFRRAF